MTNLCDLNPQQPTLQPGGSGRLAQCRDTASMLLLQRSLGRMNMSKTLRNLVSGLNGVEMPPRVNPRVRGLATDSRRVTPGALFFAMGGRRTHGHRHIEEAVEAGASAVISEEDCWVPPRFPLVRVADIREAVAHIASRFYDRPQEGLALTGLLGTSGKTVTGSLLQALRKERQASGFLGTIHYSVGHRSLPAHRTTPEPVELYSLLREVRSGGLRRVILEVSSHGIDQRRVEGLQFGTLALLNLTPEHLEYHGSLDSYVELEEQFIRGQADGLRHLVAGVDDPQVGEMLGRLGSLVADKVCGFGLSEAATIRATEVELGPRGTRFRLQWPEGSQLVESPLVGEFHLQNTLAALACGYVEGLEPAAMLSVLSEFRGVRGRMERIEEGQPFTVLTDYMHTVAAYDKGLEQVRALGSGRLITVFGCGGDRDPRARPEITRLVAQASDYAIATTDNPRSEEVGAIFADMLRGNEDCVNLRFVKDRREAIAQALAAARPGDTVLIAGKGHESFQEYADCVVPFDDRAVVREIMRQREWKER